MTQLKQCICDSKYQDEKYGKRIRVHNDAKPKSGTSKDWVCTVCNSRKLS